MRVQRLQALLVLNPPPPVRNHEASFFLNRNLETAAESQNRRLPITDNRPAERGSLMKHKVTPDGRYFVVRGRLWRMANPSLAEAEREELIAKLMAARRLVRQAKKGNDREGEAAAHKVVDEIKRALGERGPPWWDDGSPDVNRHLAGNTSYADWYARLVAAR
jgi:hypothetical protein